ncbi:MEI2-like 4, putative isoform 1 [Hibiscus syriacus]|uniref:MEI2-like 4, putative isoform 1 n=1 Tax=Hibiscus syriacus TaxID=106335 RepID=A0A6A2Y975_HIBSY|nr:MEI2-like 4, putative isoform 1 [Hibiscus syriacus]
MTCRLEKGKLFSIFLSSLAPQREEALFSRPLLHTEKSIDPVASFSPARREVVFSGREIITLDSKMEIDVGRSDFEKDEEEDDDSVSDLLRDRFHLSAISIAEYEGLLVKDLELFSHHTGRKSVTMGDVIVSGECVTNLK